MSTTPAPNIERSAAPTHPWSREDAVQKMYDAEVALHCAKQSQVQAWVDAAYRRLHEALDAYALAS
ncbi:MAG: hypothetical protein QOK10_2556 [Pseudonocardiales bacterium]|jgi:hypothetical protein|nr:hypothetical protein [Pseudonocardiales bacterium]